MIRTRGGSVRHGRHRREVEEFFAELLKELLRELLWGLMEDIRQEFPKACIREFLLHYSLRQVVTKEIASCGQAGISHVFEGKSGRAVACILVLITTRLRP